MPMGRDDGDGRRRKHIIGPRAIASEEKKLGKAVG